VSRYAEMIPTSHAGLILLVLVVSAAIVLGVWFAGYGGNCC
jgi:hypothetical protein